MPKTNINYQNTIIYKIVCNDLNVKDVYVGHTTDFRRRKSQHKNRCANVNDKHYNLNIYKIIRENGGWENWSMIEIEKYPCTDSKEATARERYWFEELQANMNSIYPQRTVQEYRQENKEAFKQYYLDHKEEITARQKTHYINNREHKLEYQKQYSKDNQDKIKAHKKQYGETHKDERREYDKNYNLINKDMINSKRNVQIECQCGGHYTLRHKARHFKSLQHIKVIEQQNL